MSRAMRSVCSTCHASFYATTPRQRHCSGCADARRTEEVAKARLRGAAPEMLAMLKVFRARAGWALEDSAKKELNGLIDRAEGSGPVGHDVDAAKCADCAREMEA